MPDAFATTLKDFERVVDEIGETRERLQALERERDQLRKQLKVLAGSSEGSIFGSSESGAAQTAISEIVDVVRRLQGSARLADIAKRANLDPKVAATRLQRAVRAGALVRVAHGQYQLPPEELQVLMAQSEAVSSTDAVSSDQ